MSGSRIRCCLCPSTVQTSNKNLLASRLIRCEFCNLISYCGPKHQQDHWPKHKTFCEAIQSVMKDLKLNHMKEGTVYQMYELNVMIQTLVIVTLRRNLTSDECELIWFPRICKVCNSCDESMIPCPNCFVTGYCSEKHQKEDKVKHLKVCWDLHLFHIFSRCLPDDDVKHIPYTYSIPAAANFPKDLFEMYRLSTGFTYEGRIDDFLGFREPNSASEYRIFTDVCNLCNVATILYALSIVQHHKQIVSPDLTIHIVGANLEIALFSRTECWLFFCWLQTISKINLIFIGPDLPVGSGFTEITYASTREKVVKCVYMKMNYEEFIQDAHQITPNLIVAFNGTFDEHVNESRNLWNEEINVMLAFKDVPFMFTSLTKAEATSNMKVLAEIADDTENEFQIVCDGDSNQFKDYRPFPKFINNEIDVICYYNGYLSIILTGK